MKKIILSPIKNHKPANLFEAFVNNVQKFNLISIFNKVIFFTIFIIVYSPPSNLIIRSKNKS